MEEQLKQLAHQEGLPPHGVMKFTGWSAEVDTALRDWDLFIFSTTVREGFGNAAAEAMAYGLPCILTDVGPCRSVGGEAALYTPPFQVKTLAQLITSLAQNFPERQRLAGLARQRAIECFQPARKLADFLRFAWPTEKDLLE
jgi:glycosyltransferase involved in cell wall biosynthesis